jgi:hypothetical protein
VARELATVGLRSDPKTGVWRNGESFGLQREQAPSPQGYMRSSIFQARF